MQYGVPAPKPTPQVHNCTYSLQEHHTLFTSVLSLVCSLQQLSWHDGIIPDDEVWVKVGGDKGGSSFKMSFQIVNTHYPNSIENTCVFTVFEARDNRTNLEVALEKYKPQISQLQSTSWQ